MTNKKKQENVIQLVEKHIIKPSHELWSYVDTLCWQTRCLRNKANFIIRQNFFSKKNHKFLNYNFVDKLFKKHKDLKEVYKLVPRATISQQCLRQLNNEWQSFFSAINVYKTQPSKFQSIPKPPKYKKDRQTYIAVLLPQEFKVFNKYVQLPNFLNNYQIPYKHNGKLTQIRFIPCSNNVYKVVDYAIKFRINTIIIGYNENWKQECNMGKQNNQNFVQIPYLTFIRQLQYKAKLKGITVVLCEESYTSGTSFLDNEYPNSCTYNRKRRIYRGLFKSNDNILINADVNSSYQILIKALTNIFSNKDYVIEGLQDMIKNNLSYALNPNKVTINNNIAINKLY